MTVDVWIFDGRREADGIAPKFKVKKTINVFVKGKQEQQEAIFSVLKDRVDQEISGERLPRLFEFFLRKAGETVPESEVRQFVWGDFRTGDLEELLKDFRRLIGDLGGARDDRLLRRLHNQGWKFLTEEAVKHFDYDPDAPAPSPAAPSGGKSPLSDSLSPRSAIPMSLAISPEVPTIWSTLPPKSEAFAHTDRAYCLPEKGWITGRDAEIEIAKERWLQNPKQPLLIHGPPGIGKSKLALALLHHPAVAARFGQRRFRIVCDEFASVDRLISRVGDKWFGLPFPATESRVLAQLSEGPCAVLLDNYETLLRGNQHTRTESIRWLNTLLGINNQQGGGLWLIVGAQEFPAGDVDWADPLEPSPLSFHDATEMYRRIGRRPGHTEHPRFEELLDQMGGVPRAIELLAAQATNYRKLDRLLERWYGERTAMLKKGAGASRTESVDVSYDFAISSPFLDADDRKFLRLLAFLPGGITEQDFEKVMNGGQKAAGALHGAALAYYDADRLKMLPPQREYLSHAERKASDAEKQRAIAYFLALATEDDDHRIASEKLLSEFSNCIAVLQDALAGGNKSAIMASAGLGRFVAWTRLGYTETTELLKKARQVARDDRRAEGWCIWDLAQIARAQDWLKDAIALYEEARKCFDESSDRKGKASCICGLAEIALRECKFENATALYEEARKFFHETDDWRGEGWCSWGLAKIELQQGRLNEATAWCNEAGKCFREGGDRRGEGSSTWGSAQIAFRRDRFEDATALYEQAQELLHQSGDRSGEGWCLSGLAQIAFRQDRFEDAAELYERARDRLHEGADRSGEGWCICGLAQIAIRQCRNQHATVLYEKAQEVFEKGGDKDGISACIEALERMPRSNSDGLVT